MKTVPQWKKAVITAVKCGWGLHMFSFTLVGVVCTSCDCVVLCGRQWEDICRLSNSTQVTKEGS